MNPREDPTYAGYQALMMALFGPSGQPPAWRADAACTGEDTELFFNAATTERAVSLCAGCPVRDLCHADQVEWESRTRSRRFYAAGVVGGTSGSERNQTYYPRKSRSTTTTTKEVA